MRPLIVASPSSGCGKSSVTLGLLGALRSRGLAVAPFKVGPDFIDPGHHAAVCGRPSRNLDGWMCGRTGVYATYTRGMSGADLAVIEGVMGLFDGADGASDLGSTAEIARWLGGRILLVIDVRAQARSAAAVVKGFSSFAPDLEFAGVLYNRVGSSAHSQLLRDAHASVPELPPLLGCLPRDEAISLPERHLGLITASDAAAQQIYARLAERVAAHLDLKGLLDKLNLPTRPLFPDLAPVDTPASPPTGRPVRIGVARDAAFCFCYEDNLELLERAGAELHFFSPLDDPLPKGLSGLYLPGGYPELYLKRLAANLRLLSALRQAAASGMPIYAECGGLLYLCQGIDPPRDLQPPPRVEPLAGLFPARARMLDRRKSLGYREITISTATSIGPAGMVVRGHEFHYSTLELPPTVQRAYQVRDRTGAPCAEEGYLLGNVLGSYVHLHFASNPQVAENFVESCRRWQLTPP